MILTIGPGGCGFTFVNWSIAYLRGDESYLGLDGVHKPVDINPLSGPTAHHFSKDHLKIESSKALLECAHDRSIIYITPGSQQHFEEILTLPGKKLIFDHRSHEKELLARSMITMPRCGHGIEILFDRLKNTYGSLAARQGMLFHAKLLTQYYRIPVHDSTRYFLLTYPEIFQTFDKIIDRLFAFLDHPIDLGRQIRWNQIYDRYRDVNQDYITRFVGGAVDQLDSGSKRSIFKEIYNWTHGGCHLINCD